MELQDKQIAVVGGGPGGLTLAKLLQLQGLNVKVYERDLDKHARVQGSPLDLHEDSGLAALQKAGLIDAFKSNFMPGADRMTIADPDAKVMFSDHDHKPADDFGSEYFRPEIDRAALRKILLASLDPETVEWDSHFIAMERQGAGWLLQFKNGLTIYADIVIAADGANSKIRPLITGIKPFYSGITMLEGNIYDSEKTIPNVHKLLKGGKIMAFGNAQNLLLGQKANGEVGFYASFKASEDWASTNGLNYNDRNEMLEWFRTTYPEWAGIWYELFENAALPLVPRPIYCMPPDQTWATLPNLTVLGDAAHLMPPFAGEGVNMSMRDALDLSECLTGTQYTTTFEAINAYEIGMRKRAAIAATESLENGERMHSETALADMLQMFGSFK